MRTHDDVPTLDLVDESQWEDIYEAEGLFETLDELEEDTRRQPCIDCDSIYAVVAWWQDGDEFSVL